MLMMRATSRRLSARLAPRLSRSFSAELAEAEEAGGFSLALTDEQTALKELARDFAKNEMIPVAAHYDQTMEYPTDVFTKAWELGLINTHVP